MPQNALASFIFFSSHLIPFSFFCPFSLPPPSPFAGPFRAEYVMVGKKVYHMKKEATKQVRKLNFRSLEERGP